MSSSEVFWGIGNFCQWLLGTFYDNIGNVLNNTFIVVGFIGLFIWLRKQRRWDKEEVAATSQNK